MTQDRKYATDLVSYYVDFVEVHRSARKHGVADADIVQAATSYLAAFAVQDEEPPRQVRIGFDTTGRLLEIVVLLLDEDRQLVIHAMRARRQYLDLLP